VPPPETITFCESQKMEKAVSYPETFALLK